ncbi:MAG: acyltransferase [Lachnospiraceae bacterium]|nr:acyltransferase [Lachnospiraceae bacterium]MBQ7782226.1 acyltransferase [Lachnospiraceae bacterium]
MNKVARYNNIDLMKFLGMLFVVIYHSTTVKCNILDNSSIYTYINYLVRPILSTCVPIFFFCNGFLLIQKKFDLKQHIIKMIRLTLLTGIWGVIALLFLMPIKGEWFSLKEFIVSLLTWKQGWINYLWFMGALVCVYIVFPLIKSTFDYNKNIFNYCLVICMIFVFGNVLLCMIATAVKWYRNGGGEYVSYNFFNMFNPFRGIYGFAFAYFGIGCFFGGNQKIIQERINKCKLLNGCSITFCLLVSALLLGGWGVLSTKCTGEFWDVVWNGYDTIFTLINVLAIYVLCVQYNYVGGKLNRFIRIVSQNTLGIYFVHYILIHVFNKYGIKELAFAQNYLFNVLYAVIVMVLSLCIVLLLKHIPIFKKLVM